VEAADKYGQTPLHLASQQGHQSVARLLLDKRAKVDAADMVGQTPYHLAGHLVLLVGYADIDRRILPENLERPKPYIR